MYTHLSSSDWPLLLEAAKNWFLKRILDIHAKLELCEQDWDSYQKDYKSRLLRL